MLWAGTMEAVKEFFGKSWAWLADANNYNPVMVLIAVAAGIIIPLLVATINRNRSRSVSPPPDGEVRLTSEKFLALLEEREREVEQRLAQAPGDERSQLENELTEVKRQLFDSEKAHAEAQTRIRELETALPRLGDDISDNRLAEIRAAIETGDFSRADALLAEIEDRTDAAVVRAAEAAFQRGQIAAIQIKWGEAATHFDKAARLNPTYDNLNEAGKFAQQAAQYTTALRHFEKLLDLSRREHGERSPETAPALNNLAGVLRATGQYAEAELLYRQALAINQKALGEEHPDYATGLSNLAGVLRATGQYAEAEPLYRQALAIRQKALGEEHPDYAIGLNNLATMLQATGQYAEAEPLYHQALEIIRASLGDDHPNTRRLAGNYVRLLRAQFPDNPALTELNTVFGEDVF